MYAITAVTGHVGGATARALLAAGAPVRAVVRTPAAAQLWSDLGAEVVLADFTDQPALAAAVTASAATTVATKTNSFFMWPP